MSSRKAPKTMKISHLSLAERAAIKSRTKRNKNVAEHRGLTVRNYPLHIRLKEARLGLNMKSRVQMDINIPKLGRIIEKLEDVVDAYREKLDQRNVDSDLMTELSLFLDCIIYRIRMHKDSFISLDTEPDDPVDVITNLTEYVKKNIVMGYKKARDLISRIRMANTIISIFHVCIAEFSPKLYLAIAAEANKEEEEEEESEEEDDVDGLVNALESLLRL